MLRSWSVRHAVPGDLCRESEVTFMGRGKEEEEKRKAEISRAKVPNGKEVLGRVISLVGGARMVVDCQDGKERMCRVPGKIRRRIWVREGDYVIIKPWDIGSEKNGDVMWRYSRIQADYLKSRGIIKF